MSHLEVKSTGKPLADMKRKECLNLVNDMSDDEIGRINQLLTSKKGRGYIANAAKFMILKRFI